MLLIRFYTPFNIDFRKGSSLARENFLTLFNFKPLDFPNMKIVDDDSYTHVVIINDAMPILKPNIPKSRVLGIAYEPYPVLFTNWNKHDNINQITKRGRNFIQYAQNNIGLYLIGDKRNLPSPFIEHYGFLWHLPVINCKPTKTKTMSIIFSEKKMLFGHRYRHDLVNRILNSDMDIDIWGRGVKGLDKNNKDPRIKSQFNGDEPYKDYKFSICIENVQCNDYISEKFTNCLIYNCTPIYYGAKNVNKWFGNNCCYKLVGDPDKDIELIKSILEDPINKTLDTNLAYNRLTNGECYLPKYLNNFFKGK